MPGSHLPPFRPVREWSLHEAASAMGAECPEGAGERRLGEISTDSRTIRPGDAFLAIKGETFDGHQFCAAAAEKGAGSLIVSKDFPAELDGKLPVLRVADPLFAYGELARVARVNWGGRVLAISGSVGKTTTRRILARSLERHRKVLEPVRNFNNLIGVPQTILRLEPDHSIAVLELGMNMPGELARLVQIAAPNVSGLTRVGLTHAGMFATPEDLVEAKFSMYSGAAPGVPIVVNTGCANCAKAIERFCEEHPVVTFSVEPMPSQLKDGKLQPAVKPAADCYVENIRPIRSGGSVRTSGPPAAGYVFDLVTPARRVTNLELRHFGRQILEDIACAAAFLVASGFDPEWIARAVHDFQTEPLRGQIVEAGGWTFILDCYNASPDSMRESLKSLFEVAADRPDGTRLVLVLADMLELGDHSAGAHAAMLEFIRPLAPALFFGLGERSRELASVLAGEGWEARGFESRDDLTAALRESLLPGDLVFFKGSHGFALEKAAQALAPAVSIDPGAAH